MQTGGGGVLAGDCVIALQYLTWSTVRSRSGSYQYKAVQRNQDGTVEQQLEKAGWEDHTPKLLVEIILNQWVLQKFPVVLHLNTYNSTQLLTM